MAKSGAYDAPSAIAERLEMKGFPQRIRPGVHPPKASTDGVTTNMMPKLRADCVIKAKCEITEIHGHPECGRLCAPVGSFFPQTRKTTCPARLFAQVCLTAAGRTLIVNGCPSNG